MSLHELYLSIDWPCVIAFLCAELLVLWVYRIDRAPEVLPKPRMDTIARGPLESWRVSAGRVRTP